MYWGEMMKIYDRAKNYFFALLSFFFGRNFVRKTSGFMKNLGFLAAGEFLGGVIVFPIKILAGRILGPEEFGLFSLVMSLLQFFIVPMIFFRTATQKYVPSLKREKSQLNYIFVSLFGISLFFSSVLIFFLKKEIISLFDITDEIYWWTFGISVVASLFYFFESLLRSYSRYSIVFKALLVNSIVIFISFIFFFFVFNDASYESLLISHIFGFFASFFVLVFPILRLGFSKVFDRKLLNDVLKYSFFALIGGLTGFLISGADRFFLNSYLSLYWVGVFSAYVSSSNLIVGKIFQLFINVYFPTISSKSNKENIHTLAGWALKRMFFPIVFLSFFSMVIVVYLYGDEYPLRFDFLVYLSLNSFFFVFYQMYMWLLNSQGVRGIRWVTGGLVLNSIFTLSLLFFLVQAFGVIGAFYALLSSSVFFSVYFYFVSQFFLKKGYYVKK